MIVDHQPPRLIHADSEFQTDQIMEVGLPRPPLGGRKQPQDAGLAGLLAGFTSAVSGGDAPGLLGPLQPQQQRTHDCSAAAADSTASRAAAMSSALFAASPRPWTTSVRLDTAITLETKGWKP